ncbi:MAG: ABC transporter substrate-binding protein [Burkholderiales bacterium]|nr:ABC transporter substrate-binding protein [Burkholderiales bacterium]
MSKRVFWKARRLMGEWKGLIALLAAACCFHLPAVAEPIRLAIGPFVTSTIFYVADDQGYFAQEKLQVKLQSCAGLGAFQCMKDMLDGKAEVSNGGDLPVMFNAVERQDFVVLATYAGSTSIVKMLARKDAHVKTAHDLIGKRVGYIKKTAPHYFLHVYLLTAGVDPAQVKQIALEPNDMASALANRTVDAIATYEPLASKQRQELGDSVADIPIPSTYNVHVHLVAKRSFVAAHEEETIGLLRALYRAEQFIRKDPEKAKLIWMKYANVNLTNADALWKNTIFKLTLDSSLVTTLRSTARWAKESGLVEIHDVPDFHSVIYPRPLRVAKPEGG